MVDYLRSELAGRAHVAGLAVTVAEGFGCILTLALSTCDMP